jgi:hypothetical protein
VGALSYLSLAFFVIPLASFAVVVTSILLVKPTQFPEDHDGQWHGAPSGEGEMVTRKEQPIAMTGTGPAGDAFVVPASNPMSPSTRVSVVSTQAMNTPLVPYVAPSDDQPPPPPEHPPAFDASSPISFVPVETHGNTDSPY